MSTPRGHFSIGEFSRLAFLSVRMLRHYDEHGVLHPAWVDPVSGYRYYSTAQLAPAALIRRLRDVGFGVAALASLAPILDQPEAVANAVRLQRAQLEEDVAAARQRLGTLDQLLHYLQEDHMYEITPVSVPAHLAITRRAKIPSYAGEGELWGRLIADIPGGAMPLLTEEPPCWTIYHDEEHVEGPVDVELVQPVREGVEVPDTELRQMPAMELLAVTYHGPYDGLGNAFSALGAALDGRDEPVTVPWLTRYLVGPGQTRDPQRYVTQVCAPLRRDPVGGIG